MKSLFKLSFFNLEHLGENYFNGGCENPRFSDASPRGRRFLLFSLLEREEGFVLKTDFESNQGRQFVLLNKQKFV